MYLNFHEMNIDFVSKNSVRVLDAELYRTDGGTNRRIALRLILRRLCDLL